MWQVSRVDCCSRVLQFGGLCAPSMVPYLHLPCKMVLVHLPCCDTVAASTRHSICLCCTRLYACQYACTQGHARAAIRCCCLHGLCAGDIVVPLLVRFVAPENKAMALQPVQLTLTATGRDLPVSTLTPLVDFKWVWATVFDGVLACCNAPQTHRVCTAPDDNKYACFAAHSNCAVEVSAATCPCSFLAPRSDSSLPCAHCHCCCWRLHSGRCVMFGQTYAAALLLANAGKSAMKALVCSRPELHTWISFTPDYGFIQVSCSCNNIMHSQTFNMVSFTRQQYTYTVSLLAAAVYLHGWLC